MILRKSFRQQNIFECKFLPYRSDDPQQRIESSVLYTANFVQLILRQEVKFRIPSNGRVERDVRCVFLSRLQPIAARC